MAIASLLCAALIGGCGGTQRAADLFEVERTGTIPGAKLRLLVTDNGTVRCNGAPPRAMPGELLVEARGLTEDLAAEAGKPLNAVPPTNSIYSFKVRMGAGTFDWQDGSLNLPQPFLEMSRLVRRIAKEACGLTR